MNTVAQWIQALWQQRWDSYEPVLYLCRNGKELAMLPDDTDDWQIELPEGIRQNLTADQFRRKMEPIIARLPIL